MVDQPKTLGRFVLRARRIAAHSLASDRQALLSLSEFTLTGHIELDGTMQMRRALPDEEAFESLAARVRPVLVKTESVHHGRVLEAIQAAIDATESEIPEGLLVRLAGLQNEWPKFDLDSTNVLRFAMQSAKTDGSESTPQVSDTQLAAAWLYGDLVHVDTRGDKSDGQLFPVKERYSAAVTYFAHAVVLTLMTLDLVVALHELGVIALDEDSLREDVVIGADELVDEGVAYVGPVGSPMPSLDIAIQEPPEGFRPFTVTELLRQVPAGQVQVVLTAHGSKVGEYEAAVSRRGEKDGRLHWEALVAGAVTFEVSFGVEDEEIRDSRFEGITSHATTNRMKLAEAMLAREMATSSEISFYVAGQKFFALDVPPHAAEEVTYIDVSIDSLYDLVVIETITRQALRPMTGAYRSADRALLRRTRLLWEGRVVPFRSGPLSTTAPAGVVPQVIVMPATNHSIADTEVPVPTTFIRHPLMAPESVTEVPGSDPPKDHMNMVVPRDEPFVAWAPEKRQIAGDNDLLEPTPWGLSHFDEQAFLGEG
ncbi:hypothetical protein [Cellulomonas sp. KRMCY2]|uniref:hypothetical protein n=1 Tax=Cellulomonas sp. KRMCY2 TaxID=1304865 RepID=UPI00045EB6B0|nr:hypothetical protein [Cellulomonas sp. KRMCY2]